MRQAAPLPVFASSNKKTSKLVKEKIIRKSHTRHLTTVMPRRRKTEESKQLRPSLNRFAEDTSMLGFRYLHTRYKTWFRLLWAMVLIFFVGLTVYQVCERIAYYFIRNPLTTQRSYESPQQMQFPSIGICNKMQVRASSLAAREPGIARLLSLVYDDDGNLSTNRTLLESLRRFDGVDVLALHKAAHQKVDDLFLSCEIGKGGSCMDDIRPLLTPRGLCFIVSSNMTVKRPGPETTLSLLLNLEVYEIIPGMVVDSGVILSIHDSSETLSEQFSSGIHLEAGKVVTIPINEVRKLSRYQQYCGRRAVGPFSPKQYSRAACHWVATMQEVEKACRCRPVHSPFNSQHFVSERTEDILRATAKPSKYRRLKPCTLSKEIECVDKHAQLNPVNTSLVCPDDCEDVSYSTVVFGGRLVTSDLPSLLPGDWEDVKESKVAEFQRALEVIPNHRIPVVKEVQSLAKSAQQFAQLAVQVYSLLPNTTTIPCLAPRGGRELERALTQLKTQEPLWERLTTYLRRSLFHELKSTAAALGIPLKSDASVDGEIEFVYNESMVVFSLLQLSVLENRTSRSFGVKNMDAQTREKVLDLVLPFISEMKVCVKKIHDNVDRAAEIASDCRKMFLQTYNVFLDAQTVYFLGQSDFPVVLDYIANITKVVAALRRFIYTNRVKVLDWHDHDISLRVFESLYRDTGADNLEIHELMKLRKLMISDILDSIVPLTAYYEGGLRARINVLRLLGIERVQHSSLGVIEETSKCLQKLAADVPLLKKSAFIRGEWLSRVQRQVEIAQSYSATPQYDQYYLSNVDVLKSFRVNLLHVKLYFAHFKQERIIQERSYNVFLLLAEIGGTIGLYVGATLLTVAETIVFFIEERTRKAIVKPAYL